TYSAILQSSKAPSHSACRSFTLCQRLVIYHQQWDLNSNGAMFWPGPDLGWEGMVTVDGVSYDYLGTGSQNLPSIPNLKTAVPLHVSHDLQYSNFTFRGGPVEVTASFLSPVIPKDLCRMSIPLSYLETSFANTDGAPHNVQLYSDISAAWISYGSNKTIEWALYHGSTPINGSGNATGGSSSPYTWMYQLQNAYEFGEENDFPQWGNFTYSSTPAPLTTLPSRAVLLYRSVTSSALYTIGSIQQPIMRYLTSGGEVPLQPWWTKCYGDILAMINFHYNNFSSSQALGMGFETQLKADVNTYFNANPAMVYSNSTPSTPPPHLNGSARYVTGQDQFGTQYIFDRNNAYGFLNPNNFSGVAIPDVSEAESYYSIIMGAYVLAIPPALACGGNATNASEPLMFQKEISSDGNVNTVDIMYPAMPFFFHANPELLRYDLEPLFYNQENDFYPNGYSMHDLGSHFPNATGHVEGSGEYMPVEESSNMLLMTYAYYKFTGNADYLKQHYAQLQEWTSYLVGFSLIPGIQLSIDGFTGQLVNQTNLAIKGIFGLQAMSGVSRVLGQAADAQNYSSTAASYVTQWEYFAIDPSKRHILLSYE
ncbi:hypothetical protein LTR04_002859, partial [Oleoguttula sp. CCFEE 6159]